MSFFNRFSMTTQGAIVFIGNTLGLSQLVNTNNAGTVGSIGAFVDVNTTLPANSTWPAGTTLNFSDNASTAILSGIPSPTTNVLYAELVWGGNFRTRDQNISDSVNNNVTLKTPVGTFSITPDLSVGQSILVAAANNVTLGYYERSADVTTLVRNGGNGTYTCSGVPGLIDPLQASTFATNCVGWTLCVVYADNALLSRNLTLFVGLTPVSISINPYTDLTVSGFATPITGPINGRLLLSSMEGDADIRGDNVLFGLTESNLVTLSGPNNPINNFFCSQVNNSSGNLDTTGTFGTRNQDPFTATNIEAGRQGWDITSVNATAGLTNNQTSALIRLTTSQDTYLPNAVALQIDINQATIDRNLKSVDKSYATVGDELTYTFAVKNTGPVLAENVYLIDTIPNGTKFLDNSVTIDGVIQNGVTPVPGISLGNITGLSARTVTFKVQVTTLPSPNPIQNISNVTYSYLSAPGLPRQYSSIMSNIASTTINAPQVSASKQVNYSQANLGDTLIYTIVFSNKGNVTSSNVFLIDTVPSELTFINNSLTVNGVTKVGANPSIGVSLPNLAPRGTLTVTFSGTVNTIPSSNYIKNTANIINSYIVNPTIPSTITQGTNTNCVFTFINPDVNPIKSKETSGKIVGETLAYTIVWKNETTSTQTDIYFVDTIANGSSFIPGSVNLNGSPTLLSVLPPNGAFLGTLPAGGTLTVNFNVKIETIPSPNPIENIGDIIYTYFTDSIIGTTTRASAQSNTIDTLISQAKLGNVVKSVNKTIADVGDVLTYTITGLNSGNTTATNVTLIDTIPANTEFNINSVYLNGVNIPGGTVNPPNGFLIGDLGIDNGFTVNFQVTIRSLPPTQLISNTGVLNYRYIDGGEVGRVRYDGISTNTVQTRVNDSKFDTSIKIVDKSFADYGSTLTYSIALKNTGNVSAFNIRFIDTIPQNSAIVPGSLTENGTLKGGSTNPPGILLNDIPAGGVTTIQFMVVVDTIPTPTPILNSATFQYTHIVDPNTVPVTTTTAFMNTNIVSTQINNANLSNPVKSLDKLYASCGDVITYTITMKNTGNVTAQNVFFRDTVPSGTKFVDNSLEIDGITHEGDNPELGVTLPNIPPSKTVKVTFKVTVDC